MTRNISTEAVINSIRLAEQGSAPTGTAAGYVSLYGATDGIRYIPSGGSAQLLMRNPLTTLGDIVYLSSGSAPARLAIGTSNQVLTVNAGIPAWAAGGVPFDGWVSGETWTYSSGTVFTVPTDLTAQYTAGVKIKLTQTGVKYFYVTSSIYEAPNTVVAVTGGSDYTLANAAITNNYYSRIETPVGFPTVFNYVPTWSCAGTNVSLGDGTLTGCFTMHGKQVIAWVKQTMGSTTTYGDNAWRWIAPTSGLGLALDSMCGGSYRALDQGTAHFVGSIEVTTQSGGQHFLAFPNNSASNVYALTPFTWESTDQLQFSCTYSIP